MPCTTVEDPDRGSNGLPGKVPVAKRYSVLEERINILSHLVGIAVAVAALAVLVVRASLHGTVWHIVAVSIYGTGLLVLFTSSVLYHRAKGLVLRARLRVLDHASIYVLIAATYTPFALVTLAGAIGWVVFGISWGLAATGVVLKLFFTGRFRLLSTGMYVAMGWMIVFFIVPLVHRLPMGGVLWLVAGGTAYTVGAVLYSIRRIPLNHAVFHLFVLAGSLCHLVAVYLYVVPNP